MNNGAFPAGPGYDMASGLGTPNGAALPDTLCAGITPSSVVVEDPGTQTTDLGTAVSLPIEATDATKHQTLSYGSFGLPPGLSIGSTTGLITGTPTTSGTFSSVVTAEDGQGAIGATSFSWSVVLAITSANHATAVRGQPFTFTITATGVPTSIKLIGKPPKGIDVPLRGQRHGHPVRDGEGQGRGRVLSPGSPGHVREREDGQGHHPVVHPHPRIAGGRSGILGGRLGQFRCERERQNQVNWRPRPARSGAASGPWWRRRRRP